MSDAIIRTATPADKQALGRLGAMLVEEHYQFDRLRFLAPVPDLRERYGDFLSGHAASEDKFVLVAEQDGAIAGYVFAGVEGVDYMVLRGPAGNVYDLLVDPDYRRLGLGRRLMQAALDELRRRGSTQAVLFTADKNETAQHLFAAVGFRATMIEMTIEL
jgi:ribosomal protein S18 acetylase RimI-like enzyme